MLLKMSQSSSMKIWNKHLKCGTIYSRGGEGIPRHKLLNIQMVCLKMIMKSLADCWIKWNTCSITFNAPAFKAMSLYSMQSPAMLLKAQMACSLTAFDLELKIKFAKMEMVSNPLLEKSTSYLHSPSSLSSNTLRINKFTHSYSTKNLKCLEMRSIQKSN